jgi:hypothetical protein
VSFHSRRSRWRSAGESGGAGDAGVSAGPAATGGALEAGLGINTPPRKVDRPVLSLSALKWLKRAARYSSLQRHEEPIPMTAKLPEIIPMTDLQEDAAAVLQRSARSSPASTAAG